MRGRGRPDRQAESDGFWERCPLKVGEASPRVLPLGRGQSPREGIAHAVQPHRSIMLVGWFAASEKRVLKILHQVVIRKVAVVVSERAAIAAEVWLSLVMVNVGRKKGASSSHVHQGRLLLRR